MSQENLKVTTVNNLENSVVSKEIPTRLAHLPERSANRHHQLIGRAAIFSSVK